MHLQDMTSYLAALEAVLEVVPGLVEDRQAEKLVRLRSLLEIALQLKHKN